MFDVLKKLIINLLTFGKSLRWLASSKSSSRLLAYLMISSGTFANDWCRLSMYSTWRLHPLNKGIHLNIFTEFSRNYYYSQNNIFFFTKKFSFNVDTPANLSGQPRPLWECNTRLNIFDSFKRLHKIYRHWNQ